MVGGFREGWKLVGNKVKSKHCTAKLDAVPCQYRVILSQSCKSLQAAGKQTDIGLNQWDGQIGAKKLWDTLTQGVSIWREIQQKKPLENGEVFFKMLRESDTEKIHDVLLHLNPLYTTGKHYEQMI